jgi:hypothetical protein
MMDSEYRDKRKWLFNFLYKMPESWLLNDSQYQGSVALDGRMINGFGAAGGIRICREN